MVWKLAEAKNKFSKVVEMALEEGPQKVTRRDRAVMVIELKEFERLKGKKIGFKEYLMKGPSLKGVNLKRDSSKSREVDL